MTVAAAAIEANEASASADGLVFHRFWMDNPGHPESLWDMIEVLASEITNVGQLLAFWSLRAQIKGPGSPDKQDLSDKLRGSASFFRLIGWEDLGSQSARILAKINDPYTTDDGLRALVEDLVEAINHRLESIPIAIIEDRDCAIFKNATQQLCGAPLHADLTVSEEELDLAGRALV
jgi:hypothetical protein